MSAPLQGPSHNVPQPQIFYGSCGTNFDPNFNALVSTSQQAASTSSLQQLLQPHGQFAGVSEFAPNKDESEGDGDEEDQDPSLSQTIF
jgi:hypothetical protein